MNKTILLVMLLLMTSCTSVSLVIPPDPELPRVNFILGDMDRKEAVACVDSNGLKTLYERELILKGHINVLKENIKRCK